MTATLSQLEQQRNSLQVICDCYVLGTGEKASASGWVTYVQDATSLPRKTLIEFYEHRLAQKQAQQQWLSEYLQSTPNAEEPSFNIS